MAKRKKKKITSMDKRTYKLAREIADYLFTSYSGKADRLVLVRDTPSHEHIDLGRWSEPVIVTRIYERLVERKRT